MPALWFAIAQQVIMGEVSLFVVSLVPHHSTCHGSNTTPKSVTSFSIVDCLPIGSIMESHLER